MNRARLLSIALAIVVAVCTMPIRAAGDPKVLRITPHSNLTILDPIWTTAYISRNHGYMIYDTLFGTDAKGAVQPQMVDKCSVSVDKKTYTFTLREGLAFHDGAPVASEDVIASLTRWGKRDVMGQDLMRVVDKMEAVDAKNFRLVLKEPYGLVLEALGKPSSNVPFIMPKRVADTPADKQIDDYTGSGPFVFKKEDWNPGEKVVYLKNAKYRPRPEPASGTAGGKIVKVDRVEWVIIKDSQTQVNALLAGEIDLIEAAPFELYPSLKANKDIEIVKYYPPGLQAMLRFNHLQPPFDNPKVKRAAFAAMNQSAILRAQVGAAELYRPCASFFPCQSPYATTKGMELIEKPNMKRAQQLLKESGYDGKPIVVMQPTDVAPISKLPVVAAQLLRQAGFKVDMQAMDWQTLVARRAKKDPAAQGGWNIFLTVWTAADLMSPAVNYPLNASCDKAWFGWPCDAELEKLRERFARSDNEAERKALAEQVQLRALQTVTHVPLGEYVIPLAARKGVKGIVTAPPLVAWNISKE
jgi:peptide/nickel transport system substrate-binding protein